MTMQNLNGLSPYYDSISSADILVRRQAMDFANTPSKVPPLSLIAIEGQ